MPRTAFTGCALIEGQPVEANTTFISLNDRTQADMGTYQKRSGGFSSAFHNEFAIFSRQRGNV
jgi:hypothetical protein